MPTQMLFKGQEQLVPAESVVPQTATEVPPSTQERTADKGIKVDLWTLAWLLFSSFALEFTRYECDLCLPWSSLEGSNIHSVFLVLDKARRKEPTVQAAATIMTLAKAEDAPTQGTQVSRKGFCLWCLKWVWFYWVPGSSTSLTCILRSLSDQRFWES